jgi:hypothetical protein
VVSVGSFDLFLFPVHLWEASMGLCVYSRRSLGVGGLVSVTI